MSWELFGLYLFTRLDNIKEISGIFLVICAVLLTGSFIVMTINNPDQDYSRSEKRDHEQAKRMFNAMKPWFFVLLFIVVFVPNQKTAMFIVAGTGVVEAAKTDTAQRIASKSVGVVEKYLDEMLAEKEKEKK